VSVRAIVVAHREALAAEGIAAALARYPAIVPVGAVTSASEAERCSVRADAVAMDARIPGAEAAVKRLRRRGLRVVMMGGDLVDEGVTVDVDAPVSQLATALVPGSVARPETTGLTAREQQVLSLAATGMAGKQIARALGISPKTVEQHKTRAFKRLDVPNQAAAVALLAGKGAAWNRSVI
jgi:DNA-binding NarL/FixJ family response regulator